MKIYFKNLFLWQVAGGGIFLLILSPLLFAAYQYEFSNHQISFQQNLLDIYTRLVSPGDIDKLLLNLGISIIGVIAGTMFYRLKKRKSKKELTTSDVLGLIEKGENAKVEFKSSLRHDYRQIKTDKNLESVILKSIAGFLNSNGGTLIIGVDDDGEILGLENDYWSLKKRSKDGFEQRLMLIVSNEFGNDVCSKIHVSFHEIRDKEICSLLIAPSKRPVYVEENNQTVFFLRTGNVTKPLSTSETVKYLDLKNS
jgi:hypothetical protein